MLDVLLLLVSLSFLPLLLMSPSYLSTNGLAGRLCCSAGPAVASPVSAAPIGLLRCLRCPSSCECHCHCGPFGSLNLTAGSLTDVRKAGHPARPTIPPGGHLHVAVIAHTIVAAVTPLLLVAAAAPVAQGAVASAVHFPLAGACSGTSHPETCAAFGVSLSASSLLAACE